MMRLLRKAVFVFLFFIAAAPANAEKALEHSTAPMLREAAKIAAAQAERQYAFTVDHWSMEGDKEVTAKVRFDPRREKGEQWELLAPSHEELGKAGRKMLKALEAAEAENHPLLYEKLDEMIEEAQLAEETQTQAVFVAQVDDEEFPKDALEVFITLDKAGGYISEIAVKSKKAFKPMPIAKVEHMVQTQYFSAPETQGGPALLARTEALVEGSAMFKDFRSETRQFFSDIEPVEAAETDESEE